MKNELRGARLMRICELLCQCPATLNLFVYLGKRCSVLFVCFLVDGFVVWLTCVILGCEELKLRIKLDFTPSSSKHQFTPIYIVCMNVFIFFLTDFAFS